MLLWLGFAALTIIALLGALLPLLRSARGSGDRSDYDLQVYRNQLEELQVDLDRGVITPEEEAAARIEIERRILSAAAEEGGAGHATTATPQIVGAILIAIGIPAVASGLYLYLGAPQTADQPFAKRPAVQATQSAAVDDLETAISRLKGRLARDTGNIADWLLLGQSYTVMRRYDEAVEAYRRADGLRPDDTNIMVALGESLVLAANGTVTPEAQSVFRNAHALDEKLPGPRFYMGLARVQVGDLNAAYDIWLTLANDAPEDAPWLPQLIARLEEVGADLGKDVAAALKTRRAGTATAERPPMRGPTQEDVAAAADMSAGDRSEMIRGMVAQLAERLQENPNDLRGWERLARSYEVLGETGKAQEARARVRALREAAEQRASPTPRRGPSQEDIANAEDMAPEDQSAMIRGMVQGLAARLKSNPEDIQGWIMLARSYQVLNQPDKARDALLSAKEVAPDDPAVLVQLGAAIVDASDRTAALPEDAVALFRQVLELDARNPDALYFVGMAQAQAGETESARDTWTQLLGQLDEGSRAYGVVRQQLDNLPQH